MSQFSLVTSFFEGTRENVLHIFQALAIIQPELIFAHNQDDRNKVILAILIMTLFYWYITYLKTETIVRNIVNAFH